MQPPEEFDFTLIYNETDVSISKFKLALNSPRFQGIRDFMARDRYCCSGTASLATFRNFITGAQGGKYELTKENAVDMITLVTEWEVSHMWADCLNFILNDKELKARYKARDDEMEALSDLEMTLTTHLDAALTMPSFALFPIESLHRMLTSECRVLHDQRALLDFVMKIIDGYGEDAFPLIDAVDSRYVTREEELDLRARGCLGDGEWGRRRGPVLAKEIRRRDELTRNILDALNKVGSGRRGRPGRH